MKRVFFVGLDIAKNVFQAFLADEHGKQIANKKVSRSGMKTFFANLEPCTVGLESCATSHYWARTLEMFGHSVKLIEPIRVKAFLGNRSKTDAADAKAICEALMHPGTRFVAVKTEDQQDMDHVLGMRERLVGNRTQLVNQIRSHLSERGTVIAKGYSKFRKEMLEILSLNWDKYGEKFQLIITESMTELDELDAKIGRLDAMIAKWSGQDEVSQRLMTIPGIGPITATAVASHIGDAKKFKNGRQMASYLGVTPKEYSSGGKQKLLGITKHGSKRIRSLLIIAARSVMTGISRRKKDENGLPIHLSNFEKWIIGLQARLGVFKTAVALANKLARMAWAIMSGKEVFNPDRATRSII